MNRILTLVALSIALGAGAQTYEVSASYLTTNFVAKATTNTTLFTTNKFNGLFYNKPAWVIGIQTDGVDTNGVFTIHLARTWDYYQTNWVTATNHSISVTNRGTNLVVNTAQLDLAGLSAFKPVYYTYTGTNDITNGFLYSVGKGYTKDRQ